MSVSTCDDPEWLTTEALAAELEISVNTIYKWRSTNAGPPGARIGRRVKYRRRDVDEWLASRYASESNT